MKIKFMCILIIILTIAFFCFYKPFIETNKIFTCVVKEKNSSCLLYQDNDVFILRVGNDFFSIYLENKEIYSVPYDSHSFLQIGNILLFVRRPLLKEYAISMDFTPKVGDQKIVWGEENLFFTYGKYKENKVTIKW